MFAEVNAKLEEQDFEDAFTIITMDEVGIEKGQLLAICSNLFKLSQLQAMPEGGNLPRSHSVPT